jgi:uncharacterized protein YkwD
VALLAASPGSAEAAHSVERRFSQMINDTRTTTTLSSLDLSERLTRIARRHSRQMAAQGDLYHSDLQGLLGRGISTVGENVGYGNSLEELLAAFMASPPHAHNILGDFDRTGVGVVRVDGVYWLTELFAS